MQITDSLTLDAAGLKLTRDGFLIGEARVSRAGNVQQYLGSELGLTGDQASQMFGVYRDAAVAGSGNTGNGAMGAVDQVAQLLYRLARDHLTQAEIEAAIAETRTEPAVFTDAGRGAWAAAQSQRLTRET